MKAFTKRFRGTVTDVAAKSMTIRASSLYAAEPDVWIAEVDHRWRRMNVGGGHYAPAMANFAVRLVHGPGWDSSRQIRDQDGWDEHAAFMDGLVDDGFIILGGPVGDGEQTLHVVRRQMRTRSGRASPGIPGLQLDCSGSAL